MSKNFTNSDATIYKSTVFDRAFIQAIETIISDSKLTEAKMYKKELLKELDMAEGTYQNIKNKMRGVPISKIDNIKRKLIDEYGVNPRFLTSLVGGVFASKNEVNEGQESINYQHTIELLKKDLKNLEALIKEKDKLLLEKDAMIAVYRDSLDLATKFKK